MLFGKKWAALSGILLVSCALSSCSMPRSLSVLMGEERKLPDGAKVEFEAPHRPLLNPLNNYPPTYDADTSVNNSGARHAGATMAAPSGRSIPTENIAILSGTVAPDSSIAPAMAAVTPVQSVPAAPVATATLEEKPSAVAADAVKLSEPASTAPAETMTVPAAEQAAVPVAPAGSDQALADKPLSGVAAAPAETAAAEKPAEGAAVDVIRLTPPSAPNPDDSSSASMQPHVATAPVAQTTSAAIAAEQTVPAEQKMSEAAEIAAAAAKTEAEAAAPAEAPSLASVPDAPERTTPEQIAADMNSLSKDREASQAAGQQLMSDAGSTVMTSPETGQLVDDAAKAQPVKTEEEAAPAKQKTELNSKTSEKMANDKAVADAQLANLITPPSEASQTEAAPMEVALATTEQQALESLSPASGTPEAPKTDTAVAAASASEPVPAETAAPAVAATPVAPEAAKVEQPAAAPAEAVATTVAPEAPVAPAPVEAAPSAGTPTEVVQLKPPAAVSDTVAAGTKQELSDVVQGPAEANSNGVAIQATEKAMRLLPEPRYAAKRRLAPINEAY